MAGLFERKRKVEPELMMDADILLMVEKGITGGICYAIHRHPKANNKCTNHYDPSIESSCLIYLDVYN